jgi:hypothetical protein
LPLLLFATSGCETPTPTARSFNYMRLPTTSKSDAYTAAREVMRERFRIEHEDRGAGIIRAFPQESAEAVFQGRVGDIVGVPRRVRKVATVHVTGSEKASEVFCKVVVQQDETEDRRLFDREMSIDDTPISTPVDRGSATTTEQNTIWRTTGRDKAMERAIRLAIDEVINRNIVEDAPS